MCQASMNDYRMATHLVRWWKTKILSGYKQFTAVLPTECGDGRPSDTEELLRPDCDPPPTTPPLHHVKPPQPQATPQEPPKRELNFEGFECDVSLEGAGDPSDRQEFSFTLYDFDGHGKITKDDIAGLVTTIYDTLGSSIRVPHYGSKTIKVKLTVAQDPSPAAAPGSAPPPAQPRRYKRDLNVTIRERRRRHARRHSVSSSAASEDREADVSEDEDEPSPPPASSRLQPPHTNSCRQNTVPSGLHSRSKKRSSSLQRQELLQIIQANMEKNNLCFKTSRKHFSPAHDPSRHKASPPHWDKCGGRGRGRGEAPHSPQRSAPTTSPHHLKHRHREQEQARAMAQVVRWLEQEFSSPKDNYKHKSAHRTEHHHVHEHVHHHYHHYQDTPVLV
ncbi:protein naked cuticle homolog 2 isoform X2 [Macrosteles quadrilineatus]|uniref:protein naked cuticle homolog 2 isoform X2 n=1 Tax=Macrosteles quadrilineatus TaxID=74068 RepID=UPI0023E12132|nr:protein naked cuticle homolog 2 isoform X2 [Macrosteles quadrilineatus]